MLAGDDGFDAESLLHSLMENVPGAIYRAVHDGDWPIQRVSDEIEAITGYPAGDFVDATKLESITHPEDAEAVQDAIAAAIAADRPWVLEFRIVHADGDIRWIHERGVKTIDRDGREWIDGILFDITERHEAKQLRIEREMERLRVSELEASRARIIAAADEARRRIERDLHDGAQQRLVVASLHLGAARREASADAAVAPLLDAARAELDAGLAELRELARGIHPAVLTDRGLVPAVEALVRRSTVPVAFEEDVGPRLAPAVETALYYVIVEALTNVERYAEASCATVSVRRDADAVEVAIVDDGRGGADRTRGSGLRGLEDRLSAVDGVLGLDSPPGGGTTVRVRVPLGAPEPA